LILENKKHKSSDTKKIKIERANTSNKEVNGNKYNFSFKIKIDH
jgi:hypothetical protein